MKFLECHNNSLQVILKKNIVLTKEKRCSHENSHKSVILEKGNSLQMPSFVVCQQISPSTFDSLNLNNNEMGNVDFDSLCNDIIDINKYRRTVFIFTLFTYWNKEHRIVNTVKQIITDLTSHRPL